MTDGGRLLTLELPESTGVKCRVRHARPAGLAPDQAALLACMRGYALLAARSGAAVYNVSGGMQHWGPQEVALESLEEIARSSGLSAQVNPYTSSFLAMRLPRLANCRLLLLALHISYPAPANLPDVTAWAVVRSRARGGAQQCLFWRRQGSAWCCWASAAA